MDRLPHTEIDCPACLAGQYPSEEEETMTDAVMPPCARCGHRMGEHQWEQVASDEFEPEACQVTGCTCYGYTLSEQHEER